MNSNLALIAKTQSLIAAGDIVGAESALVELADAEGDGALLVVLEQLPDNARFDREAREQLLDVFRDAADFWSERRIPFRCFYSFQ